MKVFLGVLLYVHGLSPKEVFNNTRIKIDNKSLKGIGGGEEKSLTRKIEILSISKMLLSLDLFLIAAIWFVAKKLRSFPVRCPL